MAARFGVSESFVCDLPRRVRVTGSVAAKAHGGGRRLAADAKTIARLEALVARHSDLTNDEYHRRLCTKGARLSRSAVGRLLLRLEFTRKKRSKDDERASERVKGLRAAFPAQLAGVRAKDLVFVDESGVNLAVTRTYARSLCGTRAFGSAPRNWGDHVAILSALCLRGRWRACTCPVPPTGPCF